MKSEIQVLERKLKSLAEAAEKTRARIDALRQKEQRVVREKICKSRARELAREHGITIDDEFKEFDRVSVWAPENVSVEADPFDSDHYVYSWEEALKRVRTYAQLA